MVSFCRNTHEKSRQPASRKRVNVCGWARMSQSGLDKQIRAIPRVRHGVSVCRPGWCKWHAPLIPSIIKNRYGKMMKGYLQSCGPAVATTSTRRGACLCLAAKFYGVKAYTCTFLLAFPQRG